ncbi:MAG: hypothetical protein ACRDBX_03780 [Erysipelotrichaceae bacterium]
MKKSIALFLLVGFLVACDVQQPDKINPVEVVALEFHPHIKSPSKYEPVEPLVNLDDPLIIERVIREFNAAKEYSLTTDWYQHYTMIVHRNKEETSLFVDVYLHDATKSVVMEFNGAYFLVDSLYALLRLNVPAIEVLPPKKRK